ncbi:MAG: 4'-phosphopantetheinyl transferase superfamily protein [Marivita sp.]|uniref:4'-phosphopantetheinyl transferase family protein n=1 Tax=Marivita sp. TaxID=2003365 RepID=UPI0025B853DD|nr:4'-phosphopantetheinyl transferase superfamily protein [Marivita sp.]MCI5110387.1 4'-phosphopantetheinyl transferase superfamily protein [Marivita sp.]
MTHTALTDMQSRSEGFLSDLRIEDSRIPDAVLVSATYHPAAFRQPLFDALNIPCPERLLGAVDKRRAEYLAGRTMARVAMRLLDHPPTSVTTQPGRAPHWPDGLSGSISHARGRTACLLSRDTDQGFGVDTEAVASGRSLNAILAETLNSTERDRIAHGTFAPATNATLAFSAKEALFKALYPQVGRHFGFDAAELIAAPERDHLILSLTTDLTTELTKGRCFDIHHRLSGTHVLTWLAVPTP